jgi:hypothetical protein
MVESKPANRIGQVSISVSRVVVNIVTFVPAVIFYGVIKRYLFDKPTLRVDGACR